MMATALDLVSAFVDFVRASSVSVPALQLTGIVLVAFLLGLLLGRLTKRGVQKAEENPKEREADRVVLDLERLTPLGLSSEEEAETEAMDLSALRPEETTERTPPSDRWDRLGPGTAPGRH